MVSLEVERMKYHGKLPVDFCLFCRTMTYIHKQDYLYFYSGKIIAETCKGTWAET